MAMYLFWFIHLHLISWFWLWQIQPEWRRMPWTSNSKGMCIHALIKIVFYTSFLIKKDLITIFIYFLVPIGQNVSTMLSNVVWWHLHMFIFRLDDYFRLRYTKIRLPLSRFMGLWHRIQFSFEVRKYVRTVPWHSIVPLIPLVRNYWSIQVLICLLRSSSISILDILLLVQILKVLHSDFQMDNKKISMFIYTFLFRKNRSPATGVSIT